jgi:hypothetical protein
MQILLTSGGSLSCHEETKSESSSNYAEGSLATDLKAEKAIGEPVVTHLDSSVIGAFQVFHM